MSYQASLRSEFAKVTVAISLSNGPRLMIRDDRSLARIYLDPLELESLARSKHADFVELMDPGRYTELDLQIVHEAQAGIEVPGQP